MEDFMLPIKEINNIARREALGGAKIPHSISWPVLRKNGNQLVIAYYVSVYSRENLETKQFSRPVEWLTLDILDGSLIGRYSCRVKDFSKESFENKYDFSQRAAAQVDAGTTGSLYQMFDSVRKSYLDTKVLDMMMYLQYKNEVCSLIPPSYRVFIRELSI